MMKNGSWIKRIGSGLLDLVYPPGLYCISCGKITDASRTYGLCNDCMDAANWVTERCCEKCGRPLADTDPGRLCFTCNAREKSGRPHAFDKGFACAGYGAVEQAVIFAFKYGGRSDIGNALGEVLYDRMSAEFSPDVLEQMYDIVIPVPIYIEKKKKRGYNHADIMAEVFCEKAGLRCDEGIVTRIRATKPMKGLSGHERLNNIRGAFGLRDRKRETLRGASVLLIDDIFTSGSTIDEIAALLKTAGAARVDFLAYAAGADIII